MNNDIKKLKSLTESVNDVVYGRQTNVDAMPISEMGVGAMPNKMNAPIDQPMGPPYYPPGYFVRRPDSYVTNPNNPGTMPMTPTYGPASMPDGTPAGDPFDRPPLTPDEIRRVFPGWPYGPYGPYVPGPWTID